MAFQLTSDPTSATNRQVLGLPAGCEQEEFLVPSLPVREQHPAPQRLIHGCAGNEEEV